MFRVLKLQTFTLIFYGFILQKSVKGQSSIELKKEGQQGPPLYKFQRAAISSDSPHCAEIAKNVLQRWDSIADATIAALVCMGAVHLQSSGLGGGFFLVHYDPCTKKSNVLNAREKAPSAATVEMFDDHPEKSKKGGLAVAVPGAVRGYEELKKRFRGNAPWKELFEPTIQLLKSGIRVDEHTAQALKSEEKLIKKEPSMASLLLNPKTGSVWELNDVFRNPALADTLNQLAKEGLDTFYSNQTGSVGQMMVNDLKSFDSIITSKDLSDYTAQWMEPIMIPVRKGYTLHATPPPGSGAIMAFIMRILGNYQFDGKSVNSLHLMTEAFKHAYAKRGNLGDTSFANVRQTVESQVENYTKSEEYLRNVLNKIHSTSTNNTPEYYREVSGSVHDHGTAHFSIIGPRGDAIAVTSTINKYFGAGIRSVNTGVIFNNHMDAFSTHVKGDKTVRPNGIQPGKRPVSSATPAIFTDCSGKVRLAIGGAGGNKIPSATTYVAMNNLWNDWNIKEAVEAPRIHHTLIPMRIQYELKLSNTTLQGLKDIGHNASWLTGRTSVIGVERRSCQYLYTTWDSRKPGSSAGF